jgi:SAM-dependent methyltransferase
LERFEHFAFGQRPTPPERYDAEYFTGAWRAEGNDYRLETRRRQEGRHPALIRDVFQPSRALDVGCGPGALMALLDEIDIRADGVDHAPACRDLAPPTVRGRIIIGEATDPALLPTASYDLVICREVIEHLTLLQAVQVVRNLCRWSSRFVYITTRFHPTPADLLDIADRDDLDPTHITLMNKDLLRLLLVLEGFGRRSDLEDRLDWGGKGRVLVYERVPAPPDARHGGARVAGGARSAEER